MHYSCFDNTTKCFLVYGSILTFQSQTPEGNLEFVYVRVVAPMNELMNCLINGSCVMAHCQEGRPARFLTK